MKTNTGKSYILLLIADFISSFGSGMKNVAVTIYIFSMSQNLLITALFPLVSLLPKLIITPFIDKLRIKKCSYKMLFVIGEILAGMTTISMIWIKSIYVMLFVFSINSLIFFLLELYRAEYLRVISDNEMIASRKSISMILNSFVMVVAPIVGGIVLQVFGSNLIFIIDLLSYCTAAVIILFIDNTKVFITEVDKKEKRNKLALKDFFANFKLTDNSNIFLGAVIVSFIGGATSLLTLSYVLNFLKSKEVVYTVLIAILSLGSMIGSILVNLKFFKNNSKKISSVCLGLDGILLLSVLFKPRAEILGVILFVSGILSSLVMTYYGIQIYLSYTVDEIKKKFAIFEICIDSSTALSKPVAGILENVFGNILSIAVMGIVFIITSPINYLNKLVNTCKIAK